ncbi:unnamed protein product [Boreogadus saida]
MPRKKLAWANKEVETIVCILGEEDVVYDVYVAAAAIDIRPTTKVRHSAALFAYIDVFVARGWAAEPVAGQGCLRSLWPGRVARGRSAEPVAGQCYTRPACGGRGWAGLLAAGLPAAGLRSPRGWLN